MSAKSLDQERAAYAWQCVKRIEREEWKKDYKNLSKSFPALVMSNGLMQALAYLRAKEKQTYHLALGAHVCSWILRNDRERPSIDGEDFKNKFDIYMKEIYEMQSDRYRRATEEALEILKWIRQLADAAIRDKKGQDNG